MTAEEEKTVHQMYYEARFREVDLRFSGFSSGDLAENDMRWKVLGDFCESRGIGTDEAYWKAVLRAEEEVCAAMKEWVERLRWQPGIRRPRCSPRELADIMGYGPLPFYPRNIEMMVVLSRLCAQERRAQKEA